MYDDHSLEEVVQPPCDRGILHQWAYNFLLSLMPLMKVVHRIADSSKPFSSSPRSSCTFGDGQ